ncbi:MAG: type I 3-dehydroquinate dehydratase, partial [Aquificae bacterium]|nr:type I 3-dehydroquinate dehydratase [Aquificota bacterium]
MLLAVPLDDKNFSENLRKAKEKGADLVELRVDQFSDTELSYVEERIKEAKETGLGTILTVRLPSEGGREVKNRGEILENLSPLSDYTDVELSDRYTLIKVSQKVREAGKKL